MTLRVCGFWAAGKISDIYITESGHAWHSIWIFPAIFAGVILVLFLLTFKNEKIDYK